MPDPLILADGTPVTDAAMWTGRRRAEILRLFESQVYGRAPGRPAALSFVPFERADDALGGLAIRKQISISFTADPQGPAMTMLLYLPVSAARKPVPVFLGLNFSGNHAICSDPAIKLSEVWQRDDPQGRVIDHRATDAMRGVTASNWPLDAIIGRGYGVATIYYGDLDPDFDDGWRNGVHPLFPGPGIARSPDAWGAIAAWAWGLRRALDCLETESLVDAKRVAVLGHSRLGKTALWAGAQDPRFAMVISNNSGCGGAALSRGKAGETVKAINLRFPHWFCENFKSYNDAESRLPIDQHMLLALVAPRPVYVASSSLDKWADPKAEFRAALLADPVYRLLDTSGLPVRVQPAADAPVKHGTIGYHLRSGAHDITEYDWRQYLDFADRHLG